MTRTTQALRRLGVAGIAVATIGTGLTVATATPAFANHTITQVVLTPDTANAPSGTCVTYTATLNAGGSPSQPTAGNENTLDVSLLQGGTTGFLAPSLTADFCNPTTGGATAAQHAEFVDTDRDGVVTFGVVDTQANGGTTTRVVAFVETVDNDIRDGNEPFDESVQTTFRSANNNDVTAVTVFADSKNATNVVNDRHDVSVRIDSGTFAVAGITPEITVTGANTVTADGNQFTASCTPSDSRGIATCSYTGTNPGQDTITIYVNQTRAGQTITSGRDAGEPGDTASKTYVAAAPAASTVVLSCPSGTFGQDANECYRTTSQGPGTVTATVTNGTTPVSGAVVSFAITTVSGGDAGDTESVTPTQGITNAQGQVTVTINDTTATVGERLRVTATVSRTGTTAATDTIDVVFRNTNSPDAARNITLTPENATTRAGDTQNFVATVVDSNGTPVVGATVTFRSSGVGTFTGGATEFTTTTDSTGRATVTTTSANNQSAGTQTITAFITQGGCAGGATGPNSQPNGTNATTVQLQCSDTSTNTITARTGPNPSDTAVARITLNVSAGRITAGNAPRLFGVVTDAQGNPVANRQVTILQRAWGQGSYSQLQTPVDITTDNQGRFSILIRPDRQTSYVARVTNDDGSAVQSDARGSTGRAVVVQVHNRINIATPVGGATATNRAIQVRGDLDPNFASVRVGVAILRNGRFTYITQGVTDANGAFVINVRNLPRGSYALVVYTSARQGTLFGSASRAINTP